MTKKQRENHIKEIEKVLTEKCGFCDRWGNFKIGDYRFKMQKISMRLEKKINKRWIKCSSSYYKNIIIEELQKTLKNMLS